MDAPKVTVLMTVYNGEKYLREAVDSVLGQTLSEFELVVVDDCSTDASAEILRCYQDPRLRVVRNDENVGCYESANIGLRLARARYVARLDSDDISMPNRLEQQYARLENDPDLAICAASFEVIDENGSTKRAIRARFGAGQLYYYLTFANCLAHSSVCFRRDVVLALGGYNERLRVAGDYDLWHRVSRVAKVVQIDEVLVKWREHSRSITSRDREGQTQTAGATAFNWLEQLCKGGIHPDVIKVLCGWGDRSAVAGVRAHDVVNGLIVLNKRLVAFAPSYVNTKELNRIGWQQVQHYAVLACGESGLRSLLGTLWPNLLSTGYMMLLGRSLTGAALRQGVRAKRIAWRAFARIRHP